MSKSSKPTIGMRYLHRGIMCRIHAVHPFGTMDVVALDGSGAWRVSGLGWV